VKILIIGVQGQDGAYLAKSLVEDGFEVHGANRNWSDGSDYRLKILDIEKKIKKLTLNLESKEQIREVIKTGKYSLIFNLAALSSVEQSWKSPLESIAINSVGVLNLLEVIRKYSKDSKFFQASSSEIYENSYEPISENFTINPKSPYALSKYYAHQLTKLYRQSYSIFATTGILFNHESPLRDSIFLTRKISIGLAKYIKKNKSTKINLGNINIKRDWGYAPEYVEGMRKIIEHSEPDDFILATGKSMSIRDYCTAAASSVDIKIEWFGSHQKEIGIDIKTGNELFCVNKNLYRPLENLTSVGNPLKAKTILGWEAKVTGEKLPEILVAAEINEYL
jgi:GDPmannose 4,6-dehydratase